MIDYIFEAEGEVISPKEGFAEFLENCSYAETVYGHKVYSIGGSVKNIKAGDIIAEFNLNGDNTGGLTLMYVIDPAGIEHQESTLGGNPDHQVSVLSPPNKILTAFYGYSGNSYVYYVDGYEYDYDAATGELIASYPPNEAFPMSYSFHYAD